MAKMGRPSKYTDELADHICDWIATSSRGLHVYCKQNNISVVTIFRWLDQHEYFRKQYARARELQAEFMVSEAFDIADESSNDTITTEDGRQLPNSEWMQRSRLRVDTRKWAASKLLPKLYGDRTVLAGDPEAPLNPVVVVKDTMSAEELAKLKGK